MFSFPVRTETRRAALNIPKVRVECELEEPRISTSSADSTCKFPGYFRAAAVRILKNIVMNKQIVARDPQRMISANASMHGTRVIFPIIDECLDMIRRPCRREVKMGHGLSQNRSLLDISRSELSRDDEVNPGLSVLRACKIHLMIELLSYENENLRNISNWKNNVINCVEVKKNCDIKNYTRKFSKSYQFLNRNTSFKNLIIVLAHLHTL